MSKAGYLQKLLNGATVSWKSLGEVCEIKNGYTPSKSKTEFWDNGDIPWFRMEDIRKSSSRVLDNSIQHVTSLAVKSKILFPANSIIISTTATIGEHALITRDFLCNQQLTVLSIKDSFKKHLDHKYLFYYGFIFSELCKKSVGSETFPIIRTAKVKSFQIALPPLRIQKKIASMLDKFTELELELKLEKKEREKQYTYYQNSLLEFNEEYRFSKINKLIKKHSPNRVKYSKLKDIGSTYNGLTGKSKDDFGSGNGKYVSYKSVFSDTTVDINKLETVKIGANENQHEIKKGDVLFTTSSEILEECGMSSVLATDVDGPIFLNSFCFGFRLHDKSIFLPKFFKHLFRDFSIRTQIIKTANGVTRFNISKENFLEIKIPVLSLKAQQEIVDILDKFDTLANDDAIGLPAEIAGRHEQYEHYRNQLLNFEEAI